MNRQFGPWLIKQSVTDKPSANVLVPHQVHGGKIVRAETLKNERVAADGVLLDQPELVIGILTADCLPLCLLTARRALALHISRKTLIYGLLDQIPSFLKTESIQAAYLGPHICPEHFVFTIPGPEIVEFEQKFPSAVAVVKQGHALSLRIAVQYYFEKWHLPPEAVWEEKVCTYEEKNLPSYRRQKELRQHLLTVIKRK